MNPEGIAFALRGKKSGNAWIAHCPAHDDRKPSLSISTGDNGQVLVYCHSGCSQLMVIQRLRDLELWPTKSRNHEDYNYKPIEQIKVRQYPNTNKIYAQKIWDNALPSDASPVINYLASRLIYIQPPPSIRYAELKHPSGEIWPVMIAKVTHGCDEKFLGIHRTFLSFDGKSKAPIEPTKMMLGRCSGGAVRLSPHEDFLMIGEGIETCLAAFQATTYPAWAALSANGMRSLELPSSVTRVLLLADGDETGIKAAIASGRRWKSQGRRVQIAQAPPGKDFNDLLTEFI